MHARDIGSHQSHLILLPGKLHADFIFITINQNFFNGIDELNRRFFSRDQVRNRMLRRAAEVWGYSESEIDDFDPIVALLVEACSVEFEKIAGK